MRQAKQERRTAFLLGVAATALSNQATAYQISKLTYLDGADTGTGITAMSINGGVPFLMKTNGGLAATATANVVTMTSQNLKGAEIPAPTLTDDDAFYSSTAAGQLAYTTPSALDLLQNYPNPPSFYDLNRYQWPAAFTVSLPSKEQQPINPNFATNVDNLVFDLNIVSDQGKIACTSAYSSCRIVYREDFTPQLVDVLPNQLWAGAPVTLALEARNCHKSLPAGLPPFHYNRIDGINFDTTQWPATDVATTGENMEVDRLPYGLGFLNRYVGPNNPTKSAKFELSFTRFGKPTIKKSAQHCNWAGTDCWTIRIHPRIDAVSADSGFLNGGQTLVITGQGLSGTSKTVTVDGITCTVIEALSTDTELRCTTGKKATASTTGVIMPGQQGIKYSNGSTTSLTTAIETIHPNKEGFDKKTHVYEGWFKAPETGEYRFYVAADDSSKIEIDSTNAYDASTPITPALVNVASSSSYKIGYRNWKIPPTSNTGLGTYQSNWISLTAGKYYPFKATHVDGGGEFWFTGAVEFKKTTPATGHPHATRALQNLRVEQVQVAEIWSLEVANPNSDKFRLGLKTAKMADYWYSGAILCNSSASQMKSAIDGYFSKYYSSGLWVVLTMYDSAGVVTTVAANSKKNVYTVTLDRRIAEASFTTFSVTPYGAITPKITVKGPTDATSQLSGAQLAGNVVINCKDKSNVAYKTRPLSIGANTDTIQAALNEDIPFLHGRVSVQEIVTGSQADLGKFSYYVNGRNIFLLFDEVDYNPALCAFESDVTTPLTGNSPTYPSEIVTAYGSGIMFAPIGLDFLYTSVTKPQVVVNIDGLPALCVNLNCDYAYVASTSSITQQAYDSATKVLTVTGTALPTTGVTVIFGGVTCANSPAPTYTETQIQCTLANAPRAGSIKVEVRTSQGLIPVASGVTAVTVPLVVSAVSPTNINPMGGNTLTITGSGFPIDKSFVTVALSDGAKCAVISTTETQIQCKFDKTTATTSSSVTVSIQNFDYYSLRRELQTIVPTTNSSQTVNLVAAPKVASIDKSNVSPVLKQTLTFTLTGYTDTLQANQLQVTIKGPNGYSRSLYIMSVDDTAKTITVKFNGAPVAQYTFEILSTSPSAYGLLDTTAISFQTSSTVTAISPTSGSILGGTLITITGTNFSTTIVDQAVNLIVNPLTYIYCDILTATTTQLTCRVRKTNLDPSTPIANIDLVVVLAASSEATCPNNNCKFSFNAPVASVTSLTAGYDAATKSITYTLAGTGFTAGDTSTVSLYVDGVKQTTASVDSTTSAVFRITDVQNTSSSNVAIYFADGSPTGYTSLTSLTFAQKFIEVTPTTGGSEGGTLLTVKGTGFGLKTTGLGLKNINTSTNLCKEVKVTAYGIFTCLTNQTPVQSSDSIKMLLDTNEIACETSSCSFAQLRASSPEITAASLAGNVITFTGTAFPAEADYTAMAYFKSASVAVTGWTATSATATFANGVPAASASDNAVPRLQFTRKADSVVLIAYSSGVTLTNTVTVQASDSTSGLTSSFAGGLSYTITKANVYASLQEAGNNITICGNLCPLDATQSDSTKVVCTLPKLTTTYSATTYQITKSGPIDGTWTAKTVDQVKYVTDNVWPSEYTDSGANCFIEVAFPDTQVGVLDSVKILINNLNTSKAPFSGVTKLQGYDGSAYVDILTLDSSIHEGWNAFEWTTNKPAYQKYKWSGATAGSCRFGEIKYFGIVAKSDTAATTSCVPKLTIGGSSVDLNSVTYANTATPTITTLSQRYGKVTGGESLTITGTNFVTGQTTVVIDTIPCVVQNSSSTQIQCTLGSRPGDQPNPSLAVFVTGKGLAANQGNTFKYAQYWSEPSTWGGDAPPQFGEAVSIPVGRTLLVDVDAVPQLSFVLVEGALIFAPHPTDATKQRTFDAGYIFINGGYMEVGTEQNPYTSKITITMHGDAKTPAIPVYGNKNIAVRKGELHLVGKERKVTWTMLDSTALPSATTITLLPQTAGTFDWAVGEEIVIASTSYNHAEAETRRITAVGQDATDPTKPVLTLDSPLKYKHFAKTVTVGTNGDSIDMRAEVGLLTRNVKYQGDPETSPKNLYGAHIMLHYPQDESCIGRILYTEFYNVGQAFKLGRYPIHFHVIGTVSKSLVKGNAIHQTYNRAVTIHNVRYFNVVQNVVYNTMGHSIFIEDAIETKNVIDRNLVVSTRSSFSLLNTDQTPASFWITHPDNIFTNNHAAGSERYGFWFDLQDNPINGSFTPTICPKNTKLGEFRDNSAHSNGKYGLRIFHSLAPRERPCDAWTYDNSNPLAAGAPYPSNPSIPAVFENFVGWSNGEVGAISEGTGAVEWRNFKMADNNLSQMEWSSFNSQVKATNISLVNKALIIGRTENGVPGATHGIIGPRANYFTINDVKFYNFDQTDGALGDCSHCQHPASTDSGARTIYTSNLSFDSSVKRKIWYRVPYRGIFSDLDGTLTGLGAGSWATAYFKHNDWAGQCTYNEAVYNGHICNPSVQVRRIGFWGMSPSSFTAMNIKILQYDSALVGSMNSSQLATYKTTDANYSSVPMKFKQDPSEAWCLPYVTGHKYRIFWDIGQLDYKSMNVILDAPWLNTDASVVFQLPFIGNYEAIDFFGGNTLQARGSLANPDVPDANWITGYNNWDNDIKELNFVVNARSGSSLSMKSNTVVCREKVAPWCIVPVVVVPGTCSGTPLLWSNDATWVTDANPLGGKPQADQDVVIPSGKIIVFDLAESPIFKNIIIYGCLQFLSDNSIDQHLHAYQIYVFGGKFTIGASGSPFTKKATITLYGDHLSPVVTMDTEQNTKAISNIGLVGFYGKSRSLMARLQAEAQKGATNLTVDKGLDWVAGDVLGFAPTAMIHTHSEEAIVQSYDSATGALVLKTGLQYYHFGAAASTNFQGLDLRGEVFLLTRNILIEGDNTKSTWNGMFITADLTLIDTTGNPQNFSGIANLENVEFKNMGQQNNFKAALNFWNSLRKDTETEFSTVKGISIHKTQGWGIRVENSQNISFKDSVVFQATQFGVNLISAKYITADNTNVIGVLSRQGLTFGDMVVDKEGCMYACTYSETDSCTRVTWTNSIFAGCPLVGFKGPGYSCNDNVGDSKTNKFNNNVIHSVNKYGIWLQYDNADPTTQTCMQMSDQKIAKCQSAGFGVYVQASEIRVSNMVSVDNAAGIVVNIAGESDSDKKVLIQNSFIYGDSPQVPKDCPSSASLLNTDECICSDRVGLWAPIGTQGFNPKGPETLKSYAVWAAKPEIKNVNFINYRSTKTTCGARQTAIGIPNSAADNIPVQYLTAPKFTDVTVDAMIYIFDPPKGWAVIDDCGNFPCTAPLNAVFNFYDAVFESPLNVIALPSFWVAGTTTKYSFQVVSNSPSVAKTYPNATLNPTWNAWLVANSVQTNPFQIGQLYFESLDGDKQDRSVQPVIIENSDGYKNVLNSFMDHGWDGFYTSQKRLTRFPAQIQTNKAYTINYTGTPPNNMRYKLQSDAGTKGVLLKIPYPNAGSYSVKVDGQIVTPIAFGTTIDVTSASTVCGTNRYVGVQNFLEFYLTPGCTAYVIPRDAILCNVRLQWTLAEFFISGETTFTQRLASVLGIDISRVKVVAAYEGSLNVQIQIKDDPAQQTTNADGSVSGTVAQLQQLQTLSSTLLAAVASNPNVLGAPVLDIQNVVKTSVVINNVISPEAIIQMQQGGALQNFIFSTLSLIAISIALLF